MMLISTVWVDADAWGDAMTNAAEVLLTPHPRLRAPGAFVWRTELEEHSLEQAEITLKAWMKQVEQRTRVEEGEGHWRSVGSSIALI